MLSILPFAKGFGYTAAGTLTVSSAVGKCVMLCCGYLSGSSCAENLPLHCTRGREKQAELLLVPGCRGVFHQQKVRKSRQQPWRRAEK